MKKIFITLSLTAILFIIFSFILAFPLELFVKDYSKGSCPIMYDTLPDGTVREWQPSCDVTPILSVFNLTIDIIFWLIVSFALTYLFAKFKK